MASDEKSVLIFGSGRSGTTWVQDVLARANRFGTVFEPLHPRCVSGAGEFANRYMKPGTNDDALYRFLRAFLVDGRRTLWTSERAHPELLFPAPSRLKSIRTLRDTRKLYAKVWQRWRANRRLRGRPIVAKFIRGNLMADWIADTFDMRGAVVVRHPCAVLASVSRRTGRDWATDALHSLLRRYLDQPAIVEELLGDKLNRLNSYTSMAQVQTAIWCIENTPFLSSARRSDLHVVAYEELVTNANYSWPHLARALGLSNAPGEDLLRKPSQQASFRACDDMNAERQLKSWQQQLDEETLGEIAEVLHLFEIDYYSVDSPVPHFASSLSAFSH